MGSEQATSRKDIGRRTLLRLAALAVLGGRSAWATDFVILAILPYASPSDILDKHVRLRDYTARVLGRPVELVSAPTFDAFVAATERGEYDIVLTAPHMGRLAQQRDGWHPLAQTGYQKEAVVMARDPELRTLSDLRGRTLAVGAFASLAYQIIARTLRDHTLEPGRDVSLLETRSFSNVMSTLDRGEADAVITTRRHVLLDETPEAKGIHEVYVAPPVPGFFVLSHPRLDQEARSRLATALLGFQDSPEGRAYLDQNALVDFRPVDEAVMASLDPYTACLIPPSP
ncbi:phosphate/phosphite/phosphonate ABC transporter substrate-binding protein [Pararhodospirillum photometricum]|nr:phosphate/phosphite/phosphonate ABC transporter substrate-binding protein [Pararhodospirillum photometricum]